MQSSKRVSPAGWPSRCPHHCACRRQCRSFKSSWPGRLLACAHHLPGRAPSAMRRLVYTRTATAPGPLTECRAQVWPAGRPSRDPPPPVARQSAERARPEAGLPAGPQASPRQGAECQACKSGQLGRTCSAAEAGGTVPSGLLVDPPCTVTTGRAAKCQAASPASWTTCRSSHRLGRGGKTLSMQVQRAGPPACTISAQEAKCQVC